MRKVMCLLCLFILSLCLFGCGETGIPGTAKEGVLVVGMECAYAPFNWTETTKTDSNVAINNVPGSFVEGYDVQIAKKIAEGLGLELQIKAYEWDGLIPALKSGQIDLIIAGMSPTEERKESISFTDGYYRSTHVVLVSKDGDFASATKLDDFNGANVAGQMNTIYADLVPQMVSHGAVAKTNLSSVPELVVQIRSGILDATIVEKPVALGLCESYSDLKYVELTDGFEVSDEDALVSIGVRKECNFIADINNILSSITTAEREQIMANAVSQNA